MLKIAYYPNWGYPTVGPEFGTVVYVIIGNRCYFSGTKRSYGEPGGGVTTTINAAESILVAIAAQEGIPVMSLRFFDLQTYRGYHQPPGTFALDELIFRRKERRQIPKGVVVLDTPEEITVKEWRPTECPPEIEEIFREYIGVLDPAIKIWKPDEAVAAGYRPTEFHSLTSGWCFDYMGISARGADLTRQLFVQMPGVADAIGMPIGETWIVVDHRDHPDYLKASEGERFCIWVRSTSPDN